MALKYHPDKNPDNVDAAKEQFLLVQQAYDVLSDPHERAWYNNHREQILRGSKQYEDDSLDVYSYFTATCYNGFGADEQSFYSVYARVFDQLAAEDIEFMETPEEYEMIPKFGTMNSDYETVVGPFYAYWQSYCTKKTYTWLCPHNVSEIRDRRILREIEKETKKIAQKARKERNDEIRALVAFVRRRDKRVQEYKKVLEERAQLNRIKQQQHRLAQLKKNKQDVEEMRRQQQLLQQQQQSTAFCTQGHEEQLRQMEQAYGSDSDDYEDDDDDDDENDDEDDVEVEERHDENESNPDEENYYVDELYCVACNKLFKNRSSYENHESSKKHQQNIQRLRKEMQNDLEHFEHIDAESNGHAAVEDNVNAHNGTTVNDETSEEYCEPSEERRSKKEKKLRNKKSLLPHSVDYGHVEETAANGDEIEEIEKSLDGATIGNISDDDQDNWNGDSGKKGKKSKQKKSNLPKVAAKQTSPTEVGTSIAVGTEEEKSSHRKSTKKCKKSTKDVIDIVDTSHTCVTCHSTFESKNKLFAHLKSTKHGVYIPKPKSDVATKQTTKQK